MEVAQVTVAASFASRYAVNPVIFQLAKGDAQQHIHGIKAVLLLSNSGSAILGNLLKDGGGSLWLLYWISAIATGLGFLCSLPLLTFSPDRVEVSLCTSLTDVLRSLQLPCVAWWSLWALAANPTHGLALTYWQNLLKASVQENHNGYVA